MTALTFVKDNFLVQALKNGLRKKKEKKMVKKSTQKERNGLEFGP